MIEIVYKEEPVAEEVVIKLPRNIKQVGQGGNSGKKVYIEDYAAGFIKIAPLEEDEFRYGVLLGEAKRSGTDTYIFVKAAVEVKEHEKVVFDDLIWTGIYEDIKQHFTEGEIVGWFLNAPSMEREGRMKFQKTHLDNFAGNDKICFFVDRSEKDEAIYSYDSGIMQKRRGYYVYYEKNPEMQNYMVGRKTEEKESNHLVTGSIEKQTVREKNTKASRYSRFTMIASTGMLIASLAVMMNYGRMQKQLVEKMSTSYFAFNGENNNDNNGHNSNNDNGNNDGKNNNNNSKLDDEQTAKVEMVQGDVATTVLAEVANVTPENNTQDNNQAVDESEVNKAEDEKPSERVEESSEATIEEKTQDYNFYIVEEGDSISKICSKIYGSQDRKAELMQVNGISDENKIFVGQKLILP